MFHRVQVPPVMLDTGPHDHLSRITTNWSMVCGAHDDASQVVRWAQSAVMERYSGAIYRYLVKVLRNADAADEVFQQFALQFVSGGFRHADPRRGRFRDYVKISVLRLVSKYRRQHQRNAPGGSRLAHDAVTDNNMEREFLASCRDELMQRAWASLKAAQDRTRQPYHWVLNYRAEHPNATAEEMSRVLSQHLQRQAPYSVPAVRKLLQRARERFAEALLDEVGATLESPDRHDVEVELTELGLMSYCRKAFTQRYDSAAER